MGSFAKQPEWLTRIPTEVIEQASQKFDLDPCLVAAICYCESLGNSYSTKFEPNFKNLVYTKIFAQKLLITPETEEAHQKTSWGLMHVMGAVARELGFQEELTKLTIPYVGAYYGCMKLKQLFKKYSDVSDVVAAYNAGSARKVFGGQFVNQKYVDRVMTKYRDLINGELPK